MTIYADKKMQADAKYRFDYSQLHDESRLIPNGNFMIDGIDYYWKRSFSDADLYLVHVSAICDSFKHWKNPDDEVYEYKLSQTLWKVIVLR